MFLRILKLLPLGLLLPSTLLAQPAAIDSSVLWQGRVELTESVEIAPQGTLRIAPGTRILIKDPQVQISVRGKLLVEGSETEPVIFATVAGWQGISFVEAAAGSRIVQARFQDCEQALSIIATSPQIRANRFENCTIGVKLLRESSSEIVANHFLNNELGLSVEMRSSPRVVGNSFSGNRKGGLVFSNKSRGLIAENLFEHNKQGAGLLQNHPDAVRNNRFRQNEVGLYCYQTQNTPEIEENLFEENDYGLVNFSFSFPAVRNNRFVGNKTAIQNDQFGSSLVEHNLFRDNKTAIYNNRKSNPKISLNSFSGNELGLFVDYSSYPEVRQNNFEKLGEGARLGIYQSADWEKRSGSKQLVRKYAQARGSKNTMLDQAPTEFTDILDLSGNWWGELNPQLAAAGEGENLALFFDRKDQPTVVYEGFGPESYRLDEIRFQPVLTAPVQQAGPQ